MEIETARRLCDMFILIYHIGEMEKMKVITQAQAEKISELIMEQYY